MPLRNKEHSYRSLLLELNIAMLKALSTEGLEKLQALQAETDDAKRRELRNAKDSPLRLAMDCADVIGTINWLQDLPADLCPDVVGAENLSKDNLLAQMHSLCSLESLLRSLVGAVKQRQE